MLSNNPLVTIITPTFNRANYLPETIDSILSQGYPNLEYIVLDDGSIDGTVDVLKSYGDKIKWFSHHNIGETKTVNRGLKLAKGEIVGVINSDDPLLSNAVQLSVKTLQENYNAMVVYPDWLIINSSSQPVKTIYLNDYDYIYMLKKHHCVVGPGAFFRNKAIEFTGGRDTAFEYIADFDFWLRLGLYGSFVHIPQPLATFRIHPTSVSESLKGEKMAIEHVRLAEKLYSQNDLPYEVLMVKREAYCYANFVAAQMSGNNIKIARKYYWNFIINYPYWRGVNYGDHLAAWVGLLIGGELKPWFKK